MPNPVNFINIETPYPYLAISLLVQLSRTSLILSFFRHDGYG